MLSDRATRWVNEKLVERGLDPVDELEPGTRWSPWACPLRRTLLRAGVKAVIAKTYVTWPEGTYESLPADVQAFVAAFDNEQYPHLDVAKIAAPALRTKQHHKPRRHTNESRRHTRLRSLTTA